MRKLKDQSYIPAMMKALEGQSSYYEGFYEATISTAKLWLSIRLSPLRDASGSVIGGMGVMEDITKRKQAEEKIQGQAELLDRAQDAILVRDLKHHIIYWNKGAERLYGLKEGEAIGKKVTELLYKRNTPDFEEAMKIVTVKGEWKGELHQMTKDGREVIVESRWTLVRDDERKLKSILVVNTDITEKKKIEAQFLRAQRIESIGTLAAGIAHDLNNVLSPIMTGLQLLRQKFTDEQSQNWLNILETSARRGADLVRQILSFARGQEGQRMPLQIRYLISEIEKILKEILSKSIEIHTDIPKYLWLISGDPTQLHQVLMNLCMNARDAMPNGGTLSISAENHLIDENYARMNIEAKVGPYVVLTVSDTGIGIPPEIVDRIFEPFYTTKEPGKGTGLGLSTSFGIIKSHGGFIHVHNEIGRGAQFKVYLPATETTKTHRAEEKKVELPMGQGELILAVDDEASIRAITKVTLKTNGYRVITANDGVEAIALYVQNREEIKAVILDMMMPTMDGLMTIRALRKIDPQVKIIVVSGLEEDDKIAEAIGPKVDAFLSKPYTGERLIKTLHEVFRAR
jgi:PAS domain S-box-containing protein